MVKEPRPGRVKTRLAADIGAVDATWWFRHQVRRLLRRLEDPRWQLWLAVSPDRAVVSRVWPPHLPRVAQGRGDLGQRMGRVFATFPPGQTLITGADIPGVTAQHIDRAFNALCGHDVVFGPAKDGGYWLVGLRNRPLPGLFEAVRWSTEYALADSCASIAGARIAFADCLRDVDRAADLSA